MKKMITRLASVITCKTADASVSKLAAKTTANRLAAKTAANRLAAVMLALGIALSCTGCGSNPGEIEKSNVAVIIGNTNNNPVFDCTIDELAFLSKSAGSPYTIISADGSPALIYEGVVPDFSDKGYTAVMLERIQKGIQTDLTSKIMEAAPDAPETDIASSLELGVRAIREKASDNLPCTLVICHSGISTKGAINMLEVPVATMDVDKSVSALLDSLNIDLKGIHVVWYYLCDVRGSQSALSSEEERKMKTFYKSLLTGLGAESVTFKDRLALDESYDFPDQPVSCMPAEGDESHLIPSEKVTKAEELENIFNSGDGITFDERQIAFSPGTAEFLDEQAARDALAYVASFMSAHEDFKLLICGGCAGDEGVDVDSSYVNSLSAERASAVKRILCEETGIDETAILTKGLGSSGPFHTEGIGLGDDAAVNRNVTFLSADSEQARTILDSR